MVSSLMPDIFRCYHTETKNEVTMISVSACHIDTDTDPKMNLKKALSVFLFKTCSKCSQKKIEFIVPLNFSYLESFRRAFT